MKPRTSEFTLLLAGMWLVLALTSCQKKNEDTASTSQYVTLGNLQTAYTAESRHDQWYSRFARQASVERLTYVAAMFRATAQSEKIHANILAQWIRNLGGQAVDPPLDSIPERRTYQTLRFAVTTEAFECESLYPAIIRTAELEKLSDIAAALKELKDVDARQQALFQNAVQTAGNIARVTYQVCPGCGYIVTSEKTERCPVCSKNHAAFETI